MNDTPFGFGGSEGDPDRDPDRRPEDRPDSGDPLGFMAGGLGLGGFHGLPGTGGPGDAGGFDVGVLGQMLSQLGQLLSQAGSSTGPVNYDLAKQMALQRLGTAGLPSTQQREAVTDAFRLAELWLDAATEFPAATNTVAAWSPRDWVEATLPTWQRLCDPIARQVSSAWVDGMPAEVREAAGPMVAMLGQMGGVAFGGQLGQGLATLAAEVLTSTDIGVPLGPEGTAALLPVAIESFTEGHDRPPGEVMVYLAAREAAHHRLFAHAPWLRQRLLATVEEYAQGIQVDTSRIEELAQRIDPADPSSIEEAMGSGLFEQQTTDEQRSTLARLETLLALIEGWVDLVVAEAVGDRLPGADALRETLRRRRASGGPAEQAFATLVGLELRPRQLRAAAELWQLLGERRGVAGRDAVWAHPDLLPSAADLDDPAGFVDAEESGPDPIAELERTSRPSDDPTQAPTQAKDTPEDTDPKDSGKPDG